MLTNNISGKTESNAALVVQNLSKGFSTPKGHIWILENVSFTIYEGEKVAIIGPSGSGKSTLLTLIGLLDTPDKGNIKISDQSVETLSPNELAIIRNKQIGFIFQSFELIAPFNVSENIVAPLEIGGALVNEREVEALIERVSLTNRKDAMPHTLSGGEKQRVAIARALVGNPALILADEPTGSLDRETGQKILSLLLESVNKKTQTLIIITHDESISSQMDRVFEIKNKTLYERL